MTVLNACVFECLKCLLYNIKEKFVDEEIIKEMDTTGHALSIINKHTFTLYY